MLRTEGRTARKAHHCHCGFAIKPGDRCVFFAASPNHGDIGNLRWITEYECSECAVRYGRAQLIEGTA